MHYNIIHIIHLLCAILFIGVVFFEVILLEGIRVKLGNVLMEQVEAGIINRAKKIMPWVVLTLFISGIIMTGTHFKNFDFHTLFSSSFHLLLTIKILLATSVLVHFVTAIRSAHTGCMNSKRFQWTHLSVFTHMIVIVILAKMMFWSW